MGFEPGQASSAFMDAARGLLGGGPGRFPSRAPSPGLEASSGTGEGSLEAVICGRAARQL
jgi:hypothetical protein